MKKYTMKDFIEKRIAVKCVTEVEKRTFLKWCEDLGLRWTTSEAATHYIPNHRDEANIACGFIDSGKSGRSLTWGDADNDWYMRRGWTVIPFTSFVEESVYEIHIKCVGDVTTAEMMVNGKVVKSSKAKRDPRDKFSFKTGAEYAFNRLFEKKEKEVKEVKTPETPKKPEKLKVGDRVKATAEFCNNKNIINQRGTVVEVTNYSYLVRFDRNINGHGQDEREWWMPGGDYSDVMMKIDEVVTRDGFTIGDRVKYTEVGECARTNQSGTVIGFNANGTLILVEFDNDVHGHIYPIHYDSDLLVKTGYNWWCFPREITKI